MIEANATLLQRVHLRQPIRNFNICNPELAQKLTNQPYSKVENIVGLNTEYGLNIFMALIIRLTF